MENADKTYIAWGIDEGVHEARNLKPMLTPEEQVELLKMKGVTFKRCDEKSAVQALASRDTYLHIAAFRKMFQRHEGGDKDGCYVDLDFADLLYLDGLDAEIRRAFQLVSGDVERTAKAQLVAKIASHEGEDGYGILSDFMGVQSKAYRKSIERNLEARADSSERADVYLGALIEHYRAAMPVWVFMEVVPFGTLLAFMLFCAERWDDKELRVLHYVLTDVKAVRNCCSHGSCMINGFDDKQKTPFSTSSLVFDWLASQGVKNNAARRAKLANRRMQQLVTTIAVFDQSVVFGFEAARASLETLEASLRDCIGRYGIQNSFVSYLSFLANVIDRVG